MAMVKPCDDCPFRADKDPFLLGRQRREEIARSLLNDAPFGCHQTTSFSKNRDYEWTNRERPCIGAARLIERELGDCRANMAFRLAVAYKKLNPEEIDRTVPTLDTVEAFVEAEDHEYV